MGEDGAGSLTPGIASGEEFVIANTSLFLQYYYDANPEELGDVPKQQQAAPAAAEEASGEAEEEVVDEAAKRQKINRDRSAVFDFLDRCKDVEPKRLCSGVKAGMQAVTYSCNIICTNGSVCGCRLTTYSKLSGKCETTSNAYTHIRNMANKGDEVRACLTAEIF